MANKKITNLSQAILYVLIILGLVAVGNYILTKKFVRFDLTENKMYSISSASKNLLKGLDDIVNINVYVSKNLPVQLAKVDSDVKDVLAEFKAYAGKNLTITYLDPSEDEDVKRKANSYGVRAVQVQTYEKDKAQVVNCFLGLVVLYADKKESIPLIQNLNNFEYDLAQCVMKVFRTETPKVAVLKTDTSMYFDESMRMQMRGQLPPDPTKEKFRPIFEQLQQNYTVDLVDISEGKPIDESYKTLIVPGGEVNSFTERDIFEIDQYFMKGGNLIVLADAIKITMERGVNANVQYPLILKLVEHYGVKVEQGIVLDASCGQVQIPQQVGPFRMNVPVNYHYITLIKPEGFNSKNPAVSGLAQMILPWASPLSILVDMADSVVSEDKKEDAKAIEATILVQSSEKSFVETGRWNLNPQQDWNSIFAARQEEFKPQNLAAYLTGDFSSYYAGKKIPPKKEPLPDDTTEMGQIQLDKEDADREIVSSNTGRHLVVIGDSDFLTAQNAAPGNIVLMLNIVDWLTLDENLIAIRSRSLVDRTIENDKLAQGSSYANTIRFINILLMPLILTIIGLIIFFKRREVIEVTPAPVKTEKKEGNEK